MINKRTIIYLNEGIEWTYLDHHFKCVSVETYLGGGGKPCKVRMDGTHTLYFSHWTSFEEIMESFTNFCLTDSVNWF